MSKMLSLREARAEQLLTIRELARLANVAPSTVYLVEAGRTVPRPAVIRRLAAVLQMQPHDIAEFQASIEASKQPVGSRRPIRLCPESSRGRLREIGS
jgi:transcriptional regulator with XRE-family HTH domain